MGVDVGCNATALLPKLVDGLLQFSDFVVQSFQLESRFNEERFNLGYLVVGGAIIGPQPGDEWGRHEGSEQRGHAHVTSVSARLYQALKLEA